jgi:hypothetical protein
LRRSFAVFGAVLVLAIGASAQFLGYVSTQSVALQVFNAQAANGASAIVTNIGQSAHFLSYCNTGFRGQILLEASPDGTFSSPILIASATYGQAGIADSACHVLQGGGYYQTVHARVANYAIGSVSAWYTALGSPISYAPSAIGSNGATAPVACDQSSILANIAQSTTTALVTGLAGTRIYICQLTISFNAATTAGLITLQEFTGAGCTGAQGAVWQIQATANTPQLFTVGAPLGSFGRTLTSGNTVCVVTGAVTAGTSFTASYAQF